MIAENGMIEVKDIRTLFKKQLDAINDSGLRDKVIQTWVLACRRGRWESIDELRNMPFSILIDSRGIGLVEHTVAVTEGAAALARSQMESVRNLPYPVDMDRLYAGGLLHDVGKLLEIESDGKGGYRKSRAGEIMRHPISGALLASESGIPETVLNIIACHSKEGEGQPQVLETVFIHQADFASFIPLAMKKNGLLIE
jgi:putative nucleotidyltransferase with HDIG domain